MKNNIIVNLFGSSSRFWLSKIPIGQFEEFERYRFKSKMEPHEFYLNFDVLEFFGYSSWTELPNSKELTLFPLSAKNKIEIKQGNKKILNVPASEIIAPTLFPIYQIEKSFITIEDEGYHTIFIILPNFRTTD